MFPDINLQDQVAIVTGAGQDIGRAIALVLSEASAIGLLTAYLPSPAASYMTGQIIGVDGGLTAR